MSLSITLPDIDVQELGKTEPEIRLDLAVFFCLVWKLPAGKCAAYAGIPKVVFLDELGRRGIPVNYDLDALEEDQKNWINFLKSHDHHQRHHLS